MSSMSPPLPLVARGPRDQHPHHHPHDQAHG
jgi:hypothetical protein